MGNHPSAHQPLERATSRAGNALRLSKRERSPGKRMDRLRRSFRDSFRRRKDPESSRPHQWEADEHAVRAGTCAFPVKYLGCVEVYEQRGMQVCEEALKVLRNSRSPPIRGVLHISGDGLRVVDNGRRGLIVDQTIDKVSFCSPDRNHDRAFSYICRDGTTKRWMCHGFIAKESGDRLSHAVGCAFSVCLERKKRENRDNGVSMNFDSNNSTFTRRGSFRQQSVTEQESRERAVDVPPVRQVHNPYAIARPHATPSMLQRQGSCRGFSHLNKASPFKRQLSLRVNDLPSNLERTRSHSLEPTDLARMPPQMAPIPIGLDNRGFDEVSPILEMPAPGQDSVTAMCQQFYRGLSLLSSGDDFGPTSDASASTVAEQLFTNTITTSSLLAVSTTGGSLDETTRSQNGLSINNNNNDKNSDLSVMNSGDTTWRESTFPLQSTNSRISPIFAKNNNISPATPRTHAPTSVVMSTPAPISINGVFGTPPAAPSPAFSTASTSSLGDVSASIINRSPIPMNPAITPRTSSSGTSVVSVSPAISAVSASDVGQMSQVPGGIQTPPVEPVPAAPGLPKPEQWLGSVTGSVPAVVQSSVPTSQIQTTPRRAPALHSRALSLGSAAMGSPGGKGGPSDPFDAEWADIAARNMRQTSTTNPFVMPNAMQAFQVQL